MSSIGKPALKGRYTPSAEVDLASIRQICLKGPQATRSAGSLNKQWELVRTRLFKDVRTRAFLRLRDHERHLLEQIGRMTSEGRKAAADGMQSSSRHIFESMKELIAISTDISEETQLLCVVERAAAEAYLECLRTSYGSANELLRESYQAASRLWIEFDYSPMRSQRIHLLNNVIRVEALAGRYASGITLMRGLLQHLDGDNKVKLLKLQDRGWASIDIWTLNQEQSQDSSANEFLLSQTLHEFALVLAMLSHEEAQREAGHIFADPEVKAMSDRWQPAFRSWFDLKQQFLTGTNVQNFLRAAYSFLSREDETCSLLLWFTVALDVAAVCDFFPGGNFLEHQVLRGIAASSVPRLIPPNRLRVNPRWRKCV